MMSNSPSIRSYYSTRISRSNGSIQQRKGQRTTTTPVHLREGYILSQWQSNEPWRSIFRRFISLLTSNLIYQNAPWTTCKLASSMLDFGLKAYFNSWILRDGSIKNDWIVWLVWLNVKAVCSGSQFSIPERLEVMQGFKLSSEKKKTASYMPMVCDLPSSSTSSKI